MADQQLLYRVVRGSGPALLLIHGGGGTGITHWGAYVASLSRRYRLIIPDLPGCGFSASAPGPMTLDSVVDQLAALAEAEEARSFVVCGFSLGCAIAVRMANRYPDRVAGLVLIAGFTHIDARLRMWIDTYRDLLIQKELTATAAETFARFMIFSGVGQAYLEKLSPMQRQDLLQLFAKNPQFDVPNYLDLVYNLDIRPDLSQVTVPTLIVRATDDHLASAHHAAQFVTDIANASLVELDSGHLILVEQRQLLLRQLRFFLDGLRETGAVG